jgi:hypothetical protein
MRRTFCVWLLRLHPAHFRRQFASEMLAIFDDPASRKNSRGLFTDAVFSLVRQWVLRPQFRAVGADAVVPAGVPMFAGFDDYRLRRDALLYGGVLSVVLLSSVVFAIGKPGVASRWLIGAHHPAGGVLPVTRSSMEGREPDTQVKVAEPEDPWRALAVAYFKRMSLLAALDADHDLAISAHEMAEAPTVLRQLDRNHDGKLSPEECGFLTGPLMSAEAAKRMRTAFMRIHPVLAALDSDHDGEISAEEIKISSQSLRGVDVDGDGLLSPWEVIPH